MSASPVTTRPATAGPSVSGPSVTALAAGPVRGAQRARHAGAPPLAARLSPALVVGLVGLVTALVVPVAGLLVAAVGVVLAATARRRRDVPGLVTSGLGVAVAVAAWAVTGSPA